MQRRSEIHAWKQLLLKRSGEVRYWKRLLWRGARAKTLEISPPWPWANYNCRLDENGHTL